jgi:hypothetical protein
MTTRTIKVLGWGTGASPAIITATLDGETVFSGPVELEEFTKDNETAQTAPTLFSFEIPMNFAGTKHMKITVADASVRFAHVVGNYTEYDTGAGIIVSGPDEYLDVSLLDDNGVRDTRSNVIIDNIKQLADRSKGKGTWHWVIRPGSTFEHDITVAEGVAD